MDKNYISTAQQSLMSFLVSVGKSKKRNEQHLPKTNLHPPIHPAKSHTITQSKSSPSIHLPSHRPKQGKQQVSVVCAEFAQLSLVLCACSLFSCSRQDLTLKSLHWH